MQVKAGIFRDAGEHRRGLVGRVVVEDQVHRERVRRLGVGVFEKSRSSGSEGSGG